MKTISPFFQALGLLCGQRIFMEEVVAKPVWPVVGGSVVRPGQADVGLELYRRAVGEEVNEVRQHAEEAGLGLDVDRADPVVSALLHVKEDPSPGVGLSPKGMVARR